MGGVNFERRTPLTNTEVPSTMKTALNKNSAVGYYRELERLPSAIEFVRSIPIAPLSELLASLASKPLLAVGSGGSFTAATLTAMLHESATHQIGKASTPYQSLAIPSLLDAGTILISAGGNNSDALAAFRGLAKRTIGRLAVFTASPDSKLAHLATSNSGTQFFSFKLPFPRDGFLATNSLVATSVLISRAYREFSSVGEIRFDGLGTIPDWHSTPATLSTIREILAQETLIVLAGSWTWPAAIDLESKFSEAGLAHVQLVDYRNFAHGRHFWLAKRGDSTAVIALASPETDAVVTRTLSTLPEDTKTFVLQTDRSGSDGAIDLICQGMFLVGLAAEQFGTRLTRPGVPAFGRQLYSSGFRQDDTQSVADTSVARKMMAIGHSSKGMLEKTQQSLLAFLEHLTRTRFEALVSDYDGTLYDKSASGTLPPSSIRKELVRLLDEGLILGVASGRGNSVTRALREFLPEPLWERVIVGCYGGAVVASLAEQEEEYLTQDGVLAEAREHLQHALRVMTLHFDLNPQLLSIRPAKVIDLPKLRHLILETLDGRLQGRQVVESAHSIDILGALASKLRVVDSVVERTRSKDASAVLRVGDQGAWNGNDYELLASGPSLSVDRVSGDLSTCWNISSPGLRSSLATAEYLRSLHRRGSGFVFRTKGSGFESLHSLGMKP